MPKRTILEWDGTVRARDRYLVGAEKNEIEIYAVLPGPEPSPVVLVNDGGSMGDWMLLCDFREYYRHIDLVYREE